MKQIIERGTIQEIRIPTGTYIGLKSDTGWWRNINVHLIRPYIGKRIVIYIEEEQPNDQQGKEE